MQQTIQNLHKTRQFLLNAVEGLSTEQLNKIPAGFNNNIIWNLAHLIATQQGVCYFRSGNPLLVSQEFIDSYKSGSKPVRDLTEEEILSIKDLMLSTVGQLATDYEDGRFNTPYQSFSTRYGAELSDFLSALNFIPYHEGMHVGYVAALKKLV